MADENYGKSRDTELILPPGVFAYVIDQTKGNVNTYCGPYKSSLSNTDQLATYDSKTKRFVPASNQQQAIQTNVIVGKGSYVVLENPAVNGKQPEAGKTETMQIGSLKVGQIENIPGPQSFPLWPGQVATVIKGHHLRSNQYLMVRVYDDEAAKANWDNTVVKSATADAKPETKTNVLGIDKNTLVTGQLIVIKGTDVAFYIPPTGVEVLVDEKTNYTRDAVTLERLEFAILLDESGNKEYVIGPAVVFPTPTQQFYIKDGNRKFRAFELQPTTGLYIKVIADYEEGGKKFVAGQEIFLTGSDMPIYYPREEHSIISYGNNDKSYAIAIPPGSGRYILNRETGEVDLVEGPRMYLPNPIRQVVVRRILSDTEARLYYPGNEEVRTINNTMRATSSSGSSAPVGATLGSSDARYSYESLEANADEAVMRTRSAFASSTPREAAGSGIVADALNRGTTYQRPRTITIDGKYDGAVRIEVWSGYAIQIVNSKGHRRTVVGPQTVLLQYDEYLERQSLSKGTPKSNDVRMETTYLRYLSNPVSDKLQLKTQDLVNVEVHLKYLVRFEEADQDKWFAVDNYIQYMVDHLRSLLGNAVRGIGVQEFYANATKILRDTVLGARGEKGEPRPLKHFVENGMTVYDLEVISVSVKDSSVALLLEKSRQETLEESIRLERAHQNLTLVKGIEETNRQITDEREMTALKNAELLAARIAREAEADRLALEEEDRLATARLNAAKEHALITKATQALYLDVDKEKAAFEAEKAQGELDRKIKLLVETAKSSEAQLKAVQPALVEALSSLSLTGQLDAIAEHLAPLSIVQGQSLAGTMQSLFAGTPLEGMVKNLDSLSKVKSTSQR